MTDEIIFDDEEIDAASHWYGGQGSMLYAVTSTGSLSRGTIRPRHDDGTPMSDEEWMIDLAERLEGEAEKAAREAAKQAKKAKGDEKKELLADREGLRSIALRAGAFVHDVKRSKTKSSHATMIQSSKRQHATKQSSANIRVGDEVRYLGSYGGRYVVLAINGPRATISSLNGKGYTETANILDLWKLGASGSRSHSTAKTSPSVLQMLKSYKARVRFEDQLKRFGQHRESDRPRWTAFVQDAFGYDAVGEGATKEAAARAAVAELPSFIRRHFEGV